MRNQVIIIILLLSILSCSKETNIDKLDEINVSLNSTSAPTVDCHSYSLKEIKDDQILFQKFTEAWNQIEINNPNVVLDSTQLDSFQIWNYSIMVCEDNQDYLFSLELLPDSPIDLAVVYNLVLRNQFADDSLSYSAHLVKYESHLDTLSSNSMRDMALENLDIYVYDLNNPSSDSSNLTGTQFRERKCEYYYAWVPFTCSNAGGCTICTGTHYPWMDCRCACKGTWEYILKKRCWEVGHIGSGEGDWPILVMSDEFEGGAQDPKPHEDEKFVFNRQSGLGKDINSICELKFKAWFLSQGITNVDVGSLVAYVGGGECCDIECLKDLMQDKLSDYGIEDKFDCLESNLDLWVEILKMESLGFNVDAASHMTNSEIMQQGLTPCPTNMDSFIVNMEDYFNSQGFLDEDGFPIYLDSLNIPPKDSSSVKDNIPDCITVNDSIDIDVEFGKTKDSVSADQKVHSCLIEALHEALECAQKDYTINKVYISATTNGEHAKTSNHSKARAIDLSRINGKLMINMDSTELLTVKKLQDCLEEYAGIRENFGPAFIFKLGKKYAKVKGHKDHIHFSVNANHKCTFTPDDVECD